MYVKGIKREDVDWLKAGMGRGAFVDPVMDLRFT
jgi:hypothetical protein